MNNPNFPNSFSYCSPVSSKPPWVHGYQVAEQKIQYSQETQDFVRTLMNESRMTTYQKSDFEKILRSGNSIPFRWDEMKDKRRNEMYQKSLKFQPFGRNYQEPLDMRNNTRRSFNLIQKSGALDKPKLKTSYIPVSNDHEKNRLAFKMAYGRFPTRDMDDLGDNTWKDVEKKPKAPKNDMEEFEKIKKMRIEELAKEIEDRMSFLDSMKAAKKEKEYKFYIESQIKEKVEELRKLTPQTSDEILSRLGLSNV